jgi:hypothetical protein
MRPCPTARPEHSYASARPSVVSLHSSIAFIAAAIALGACNPKPTREPKVALSPSPPATAREATSPASAAPPAPATASLPPPGCAQNVAAFEANGDQRSSPQEFLDRPHAHPDPGATFRSRDRDADGSLTSDEFCSGWRHPSGGHGPGPRDRAATRMGQCRGPGSGPCDGSDMGHGGGPGTGMGPGKAHGGPRCESHFARFDGDGDGSISETEFCTPWAPARPVNRPKAP